MLRFEWTDSFEGLGGGAGRRHVSNARHGPVRLFVFESMKDDGDRSWGWLATIGSRGDSGHAPTMRAAKERAERTAIPLECPRCPRCGDVVVGACMTSRSVRVGKGKVFHSGDDVYYHPDAISVYCTNGDCNYDRKIDDIPAVSTFEES